MIIFQHELKMAVDILLPLLAAPCFTPQQVQFTVLDIYEANLQSAPGLVNALGLQAYFNDYVLADATAWQWPYSTGSDIVISETMNRDLQKEPQVAITLNLAAQLPRHGILLPGRVTVTLHVTKGGWGKPMLNDATRIKNLGHLLTLHRHSTLQSITQQPLLRVTVPPDYHLHAHHIELFTHIDVYKSYQLGLFDCSLTLPLKLEKQGRGAIMAGDLLEFYYNFGEMPGIEFEKVRRGLHTAKLQKKPL